MCRQGHWCYTQPRGGGEAGAVLLGQLWADTDGACRRLCRAPSEPLVHLPRRPRCGDHPGQLRAPLPPRLWGCWCGPGSWASRRSVVARLHDRWHQGSICGGCGKWHTPDSPLLHLRLELLAHGAGPFPLQAHRELARSPGPGRLSGLVSLRPCGLAGAVEGWSGMVAPGVACVLLRPGSATGPSGAVSIVCSPQLPACAAGLPSVCDLRALQPLAFCLQSLCPAFLSLPSASVAFSLSVPFLHARTRAPPSVLPLAPWLLRVPQAGRARAARVLALWQ